MTDHPEQPPQEKKRRTPAALATSEASPAASQRSARKRPEQKTAARNSSAPSSNQDHREPAALLAGAKADGPSQSEPSLESEGLRLNVFLQRRGIASRRKADELILSGAVRINRKVVKTLGVKVFPNDSISVNGRVVRSEVPPATYLFNKPDLYLTTRKDGRSRNTIFDIQAVAKLPSNVQPVGRLDFRSEGLLILTNDGDLAYALSHPKFHVEKTYAVLVSEQMTQSDLEKLRSGVELPDGFAKPLSVKSGGSEKLGGSRGQWLKIVVTEGRNRLVRRMLAALGFKVVKLVRIGIGTIQLPETLQAGQVIPAPEHVMKQLELYKSRYTQTDTDGNTTILPPQPHAKESKSQRSSAARKSSEARAVENKTTRQSKPKNTFNPTYAGKKQAESMELAKQRKRRKQTGA